MVIQRKEWAAAAEDAVLAWKDDPDPSEEKSYAAISALGRVDMYQITPTKQIIPEDLFVRGFDALYGVVKSLNTRALELSVLVDKMDPELFQERVNDLMRSLHLFMGAWGYIYHHYDPADPVKKARSRDNYGAVADGYHVLLTTLNSRELTPVLAVGAQVLHEIRESLPRTSTARHWCYLRLKGMVDDAIATQRSL